MKIGIFLILLLINHSLETNHSIYQRTIQSEHYLVKWKAWQTLSFLGWVGIFSNTLLIYTFYSQSNMATSVNAMIFMETVYRLVYATTTVHWRTYNMVQDTTLFSNWLTKENVKSLEPHPVLPPSHPPPPPPPPSGSLCLCLSLCHSLCFFSSLFLASLTVYTFV